MRCLTLPLASLVLLARAQQVHGLRAYEENGVWLNGTVQLNQQLSPLYRQEFTRVGDVWNGVELYAQSVAVMAVQDAELICKDPELIKSGYLKHKYQGRWVLILESVHDYFWDEGFGKCAEDYETAGGFWLDSRLSCEYLSEKVIVTRRAYTRGLGSAFNFKKDAHVSEEKCIYLLGNPVDHGEELLGKNITADIFVGSSLYADYLTSTIIQVWMRGVLGSFLLFPAVFAIVVLYGRKDMRKKNAGQTFILVWNALTCAYLSVCVYMDGFFASSTPMDPGWRYTYMTLFYGQNCALDLAMAALWDQVTALKEGSSINRSRRATKQRMAWNIIRSGMIMFVDLLATWLLVTGKAFLQLALAIALIQALVGAHLIRRGSKLRQTLTGMLGTQEDQNLRKFLTRVAWSGKFGGWCSVLSFIFLMLYFVAAFQFREVDFCLYTGLVLSRAGSAISQVVFCIPNELLRKSRIVIPTVRSSNLGRVTAASTTKSSR